MDKLKQLRDLKAKKHTALMAMVRDENGKPLDLTDEQKVTLDTGMVELDNIQRDIDAEMNVMRLMASKGTEVGANDKREAQKRFSISRAAIVAGINSGAMQASETTQDLGYEREMSQQFMAEAANENIMLRDGEQSGIPKHVVSELVSGLNRGNIQRAMSVTGDSGTKGGSTVETDLDTDMIRLFRNMSVWRSLGMRIKTGLKNNYDILTETAVTSAAWEGEITALTLSDKTIGTVGLSPKRLAAGTVRSRQLLVQSSIAIDAELTQDLMQAMDLKLQDTMINGTGTGNIPLGILANPNIETISLNANANAGAALSYESVVALITALDAADAYEGNLAFLSNAKVRGALMVAKKDAGSGLFVMPENNSLVGHRYVQTNAVPSNIVKGTSEAIHSAMIFGNWADFEISGWGGLSLIVNPYSLDTTSQVRITVDSFWNMLCRRTASFKKYKDVLA